MRAGLSLTKPCGASSLAEFALDQSTSAENLLTGAASLSGTAAMVANVPSGRRAGAVSDGRSSLSGEQQHGSDTKLRLAARRLGDLASKTQMEV